MTMYCIPEAGVLHRHNVCSLKPQRHIPLRLSRSEIHMQVQQDHICCCLRCSEFSFQSSVAQFFLRFWYCHSVLRASLSFHLPLCVSVAFSFSLKDTNYWMQIPPRTGMTSSWSYWHPILSSLRQAVCTCGLAPLPLKLQGDLSTVCNIC